MKILRSLCITLLLGAAPTIAQAGSDDELAALKASMLDMLSRIEALEAENKSLKAARTSKSTDLKVVKAKKSNWSERVSLKGDVRYRYEGFDVDGTADRSRNRVRARLQADAQVNDDVKLTIGLASGSDDPVSTNQTLGSGGSTKSVRLNLAYVTWDINEDWSLLAGKYKNNFYRPNGSELTFDGDYTPEGVALNWSKGNLFANAAYQWLESDSRSNNDLGLVGLQGGFKSKLAGGKLTAGVGLFHVGTEGLEVFYGDPDDFFGNSFACANAATLTGCEYNEDYNLSQTFAHWSGKTGDLPLSFFMEYAKNHAADDLDTAWALGASLGKASTWKTWQLDYRYQDVEEDAVFGLLTGSDFGGGGTGHRGHILKGNLGVKKGWTVGLTYFINENNVIGGSDRDFNRIQIDSQFKF